MSRDAMLLVDALRDPASTRGLDAQGWTELLSMARAEQLIGTLTERLKSESVPPKVSEILTEARINADYQRRSALWEADCARRALAGYAGKVVLLKGTAYVAANLKAGEGRSIGDLDILVAQQDLPQVETALLAAGWEWVKPDPYDDDYYREHMHELPPLIHKERDRMIDVHHTVLPLTAKRWPDAVGMLGSSKPLPFRGGVGVGPVSVAQGLASPTPDPSPEWEGGLNVLSPTDMVCHSAAHLFADGDLAGGLRNLWDIHCLLSEFQQADPEFYVTLAEDAARHQLTDPVFQAVRLSRQLFGTNVVAYNSPARLDFEQKWSDRFFIRRMTARDGWGRPTRKLTRLLFYIRSHWLRMPPLMLAKHLWVKWRKG